MAADLVGEGGGAGGEVGGLHGVGVPGAGVRVAVVVAGAGAGAGPVLQDARLGRLLGRGGGGLGGGGGGVAQLQAGHVLVAEVGAGGGQQGLVCRGHVSHVAGSPHVLTWCSLLGLAAALLRLAVPGPGQRPGQLPRHAHLHHG